MFSFSDSERSFSGLLGNKFRQGDQNCIVRVRRILLRTSIEKFHVLLIDFGSLANFFRQVCWNCILPVQRNIVRKKLNFGSFAVFSLFSKFWTETYRVCGEEVFSSDVKNENCTPCLQSIILRTKIFFFETLVSFHSIRTWNKKFLDLWQKRFHPGCQKCYLRVYMSSHWDVGIRSEIIWKETFFENWRKNFDLFVKTAFYVSKGTF